MPENLTNVQPASTNGTSAASTEPSSTADPVQNQDSDIEPAHDLPPGTPRWVKAFGIILVVLLLAFAGMHLTGNAPTHMPGSGGVQHGFEKTP